MSEAIFLGVLTAVPIVMVVAYARLLRASRKKSSVVASPQKRDDERGTPSAPAKMTSDPVQVVKMATTEDAQSPKVIGDLKSLVIEETGEGYKATLSIVFSGDPSCAPSPARMILETISDGKTVCVLDAVKGTTWKCPGTILYSGKLEASLLEQIRATMGPSGILPNETPTAHFDFAELRLSLPDGQHGRDYYTSQTRLRFHVLGKDGHSFTLRFKRRGIFPGAIGERTEHFF